MDIETLGIHPRTGSIRPAPPIWSESFPFPAMPEHQHSCSHAAARPAATAWCAALALVLAVCPSPGWAQTATTMPAQQAQQTQPSPQTTASQSARRKVHASYAQRPDVVQWAAALTQRHGIPTDWVLAQMDDVRKQTLSIKLVMPPTPARSGTQQATAPLPRTTTQTDWRAYRTRLVTPQRIAAGVQFWNTHAAVLERAERTFGVPAWLVVGIAGIETTYGANMGRLRVLDSLGTLAFDFPSEHPRALERTAYFRAELEQFLVTAWHSGQDPRLPRGSFAGAVGLGQFMPGSLAAWAIDFDGDGRIDLSTSVADAIGSIANYFRAHHWVNDLPVWYPVQLHPARLQLPALLAPDILPTFTPAQMEAWGVTVQSMAAPQPTQPGVVTPPSTSTSAHTGLLAFVELHNGNDAPAYMAGTQNFYAITRYNRSSYYALAVHDLGQEVAAAREGTTPAVVRLCPFTPSAFGAPSMPSPQPMPDTVCTISSPQLPNTP